VNTHRGELKEFSAANNANAANGWRHRTSPVAVRGIAVRDADASTWQACACQGERRRPPFCKPACSMESCLLACVRLSSVARVPPVGPSLAALCTTLTALAQATRSRPSSGMRSKLAWASSPLRRPPLTAQSARHGEAVDQAAERRMLLMPRPRASIRVIRVIRGKEIPLLINVPGSLQLEGGCRRVPAKGCLALASDRRTGYE
jgi:hypothetical protein